MIVSRLQILGFHTDDPATISGTTALGPSIAIASELRTLGHATYSVRNYNSQVTSSGTLTRAESGTVPFIVLINGRSVTLAAISVTGQLRYGDKIRPWALYILDDAQHPLTLQYSFGSVGSSIPFVPEFTRRIVRIDFPANQETAMEDSLSKLCRVEIPGIYFDFDEATLNPKSMKSLGDVAHVLERQPDWKVRIEGHTDNIGGDRYNDDLSARRATTVKMALVERLRIPQSRLASAGFGARKPVESNETLEGRARNRRVELVRDCKGVAKPQ